MARRELVSRRRPVGRSDPDRGEREHRLLGREQRRYRRRVAVRVGP
jgi:hypothetical protein